MANDLAQKLGDGDGAGTAIRTVRPVAGNVTVAREGDRVLLRIGNVEPIRLTWREAMTEGLWLMRRSRLMARVPLGLVKARLWFPASAAHTIGHWLLAKGAEAKFQAGETKRLLIERR